MQARLAASFVGIFLACSSAWAASGDIFVARSGTGTVRSNFYSSSESDAEVYGVRLQLADVTPSGRISGSFVGASKTVAQSQWVNLDFNFTIDPSAPEGAFDATFEATATFKGQLIKELADQRKVVHFVVDATAPSVTVDASTTGTISPGGYLYTPRVTAHATDAASGVVAFALLTSGGSNVQGPFTTKPSTVAMQGFQSVAPGAYKVRVWDAVGNYTDFPLNVVHAPKVEISLHATSAYDYVMTFWGGGPSYDIPYATATVEYSGGEGSHVSYIELRRGGVLVSSRTHSPPVSSSSFDLTLLDGEYTVHAESESGGLTLGTFSKYTASIEALTSRSDGADAVLDDGEFVVTLPVVCENIAGAQLYPVTTVGGEHILGNSLGSIECDGDIDMHLENGNYALVGKTSDDYEMYSFFQIDTIPIAWNNPFSENLVHTSYNGGSGGDLYLNKTTMTNYYSSGSGETISVDLYVSSAGLSSPENAIGVVISSMPTNAVNFSADTGSAGGESPGVDTGIRQKFEISDDGGSFVTLSNYELHLSSALEPGETDLYQLDWQLDEPVAPFWLESPIVLRQTLTPNTNATLRYQATNTVTPHGGDSGVVFTYLTATPLSEDELPQATYAATPLLGGEPEFQISAARSVLVLTGNPNSPEMQARIAKMLSDNYELYPGNFYVVDPPPMDTSAVITMRYDPEVSGALALYQAEPGEDFVLISSQTLNTSAHIITARTVRLSEASVFAIFAPTGTFTTAPAVPDGLPPRTTLNIGSPSTATATGVIYISSVSQFGFAVADDRISVNDGVGVGGTKTYWSLDGSPFAPISSTFTLVTEGTHTLSYFSIDSSSNVETSTTIVVGVDLSAPYSAVYSSGTKFAIRAVDPAVDGEGSGVWKIYYLVAGSTSGCIGVVEVSTATPGTCQNPWYTGPFDIPSGTHTILTKAYDRLGRVETAHAEVYEYIEQSYRGGVGMGVAGDGTLWSVFHIDHDAQAGFSHANSSGVVVSSSLVAGAALGVPWSVFFDTSGRAYAIGTGGNEYSYGADVAVYRAGASGEIEQETFFDSGLELNDFVFGAAPGGWLVGAAQYSGSLDEEDENAYMMALWKFDPGSAQITLSTTHITGAFDAGTGISADPDGSLWIAGFSLQDDESFALSLRHYASDGHTLLGGPFLRYGYLDDLDGGTFAAVYASTDAVYVATKRKDGSGGTDLSFIRYDKTTGQPTYETVWRAAGDSSYASTILPNEYGLLVAGGLGTEFTTGALWRYGFDGTFQGATTVDAGGAKGAGYRGSELWLTVDGSTLPYRVTHEETAAGTLVDLQPPRTSLVGEPDEAVLLSTIAYVNGQAWLALAAVDDRALIGDGLGAGTTQTFFAVDQTTGFTRYSSSITLVSEGTHTIHAYSLDLYGTRESTVSFPVGVDKTAPEIELLSLGTRFRFSATDPVSHGVSAGVGGILYLVDVEDPESCGEEGEYDPEAPPGTCANFFYNGPFTLAPGTHTVIFGTEDLVGNGAEDIFFSEVEVAGLATLTPSSGPIGALFTLTGTDFGPYYSTASFVRVGGSTAPLGAWSDTSITARIPALSTGLQPVYVQIETPFGTQLSATSYFTIYAPTITAVVPSSAPIGAPFTLTGQNFGTYSSTLAFVRVGGSTAPITLWDDRTIAGTIPGAVSTGTTSIRVERWMGTSVSSSAAASFQVLLPTISTMNPNPAALEAVVTITGVGFGPYDGENTQLMVDGSSMPVSVWADRTIVWTVPSDAPDGTYPVSIRREAQGHFVESSTVPFTVDAMYGGLSFGFRQAQPLAAKPDLHFLGSLRISHDKGGRVQAAAKAAVQVPAGALPADTEITLHRIPGDRGRTDAADEIKAKVAGEPIEFGPEGSHFDAPVTIELPYDPLLVGDDGRGVAIHYFNALRRVWEPLASTVDKLRKVVIAQTDHFSIYQPLGLAPTSAAQDEFYYRDHYAYPNPSRNGAAVTFRIQPGLAQTVEVRVYDVSGRKVHESSDFTYLGAVDDGNGKGAQNTYDHVWSVSGAASGVYNFVIKASQAGQKPIVKSGKAAVIR